LSGRLETFARFLRTGRGSPESSQPRQRNASALLLFLDQLEVLIVEVEALRTKDLQGYVSKNSSKRLAAITRLMLKDIPQDPSRKEYQQGSTLGAVHRHWRRAKFFQQYRLFFRFHTRSRLIVLGWVNDIDTNRAYGSKTDA